MSRRLKAVQYYHSPEAYWQRRLSNDFSLTGAGHINLGKNYNRLLYRARLDALQRVISHLSISFSFDTSVLDIGCGNGFYTEMAVAADVRNYVGLDISEKSVGELAHRYPQYRFVEADVSSEALPLNEEFDIILAADVLFHVTDDFRFNTATRNMASLLKPGGHLILSDVFPKGVKPIRLAEHVCHRPLSLYEDTLSTYALRRLHIEPIFVILHPPLRGSGVSLFWDTFAFSWGYGLRKVARWGLFDRFVPQWLYRLDQKLLPKRGNLNTPNLKWLVASQKRRTETL